MALDTEQAPPHEFPSWPLNCLTFYRHLADDYARCVGAMGKATDPAEAARAEGDYGVRMMQDMMQAWYDLALAPYTAMAKVMAATPTASGAPAAQPAKEKAATAKAG